jgi:hypothetical protein
VADLSARALGRDCGADFFMTEVWTWRGLVTYYTVFVIVGSTSYPHEEFMR